MGVPKHVVEEHDDKNVFIKNVECIRDTPRAILVVVNGEEHWIPQTQVHADSEVYSRGDTGKLVMSKWIAAQRGLWEDED